nr:hypothetical protein [Candidatus Woesearchaeota archaeon]
MSNNKVNLKSVFSTISEPLRTILSVSSKSIPHPVAKGDTSEFQWVKWLKTYLPKRYSVDKGFVIDYEGNISEQQDIIIYDCQYTPYLLNKEGATYVTAESVYAVIEVKPKMTKNYIDYAGKKIESVRTLKRTSIPIKYAGGEYKSKPLHHIIGGIVTLENSWKNPFGKPLISVLKELKETQRIDIGCALNKGAFIINYAKGISLIKSSKDDALNFFFIKLISKLQDIGTVPAIDFEKYLKFVQ